MKRSLLTAIFLIATATVFSQELTGTWGGIIYARLNSYPRNYYFFMEVKQIGRDVWTVYNITDTNNNSVSRCLCKMKAVLPKKSTARMEFYKEGLVSFDEKTVERGMCESLLRMDLHYINYDSTEYLAGDWGPGVNANRTDVNSLVVLQRMSDKTFRTVDDYFGALALTQAASGIYENAQAIKADNISRALPQEKRLVTILKEMVEKNQTLSFKK